LDVADDPDDGAPVGIRMAHDVLLSSWPRLKDWVSDEAEDARAMAVLGQQAALWRENGRSPERLLIGSLLIDAHDLLNRLGGNLSEEIVEFIQASARSREAAQPEDLEALASALKEARARNAALEAECREAEVRIQAGIESQEAAEAEVEEQRSAALRAEKRARWLTVALIGVSVLALAGAWFVLGGPR
jgi:hypothetical protein